MAYTDFTLKDLHTKFGVQNRVEPLFQPLLPIAPSEWLQTMLAKSSQLPVRTEKAKSEMIVFPLLLELRDRNANFFTIYSGDTLNADESKGLKGECDFILAKDTGTFDINLPIIQLVEAKKNDLEIGVPQCAAQMVGAKVFNKNSGYDLEFIYGCVTTGDEWLFMRLNNDIVIDRRKYYLNELGELIAVFQHIIDYYKQALPA